ncbi:MAG: N-acetylmuramoyl-L-alanine amidase [Lacinutrix sp.]|uniref:N-acetylmuramoyl-L-alanine amidase n=1 Tax=Lacinutrix sp. TaxID=1937692 RepID=UPI0030A10902
MRTINKIIIHCSATPECRDVSPEEVTRWHVEERGWSDVGYHFIITIDGVVHSGRPIERQGAHAKGHNSDSIGVCYIGGMDSEMKSAKDTRTYEQKESLVNLICELKDTYGGTVYGHRDFSNKECPSFDATKEYENISNRY